MDKKSHSILRRVFAFLLALTIVLTLIPQTAYAAGKSYSTKNMNMAKNGKSYTVMINYPVVGYVPAKVKIKAVKSTPTKSWVDGKLYYGVTVTVTYAITKEGKAKIKKASSKITKLMKESKYEDLYPFDVFVLNSKTGKVEYSSAKYSNVKNAKGTLKRPNYPKYTKYKDLYIRTNVEYQFSMTYNMTDKTSFIIGLASPNKAFGGKRNDFDFEHSVNSKKFKDVTKFWNGKVDFKNSVYYKKKANSSIWYKFTP